MEPENILERFTETSLPNAIYVGKDKIAVKSAVLRNQKLPDIERLYHSLYLGLDELKELEDKGKLKLPRNIMQDQILVHNPYAPEPASYILANSNAEFELNICKLTCIVELAKMLGALKCEMEVKQITTTSYKREIKSNSEIRVAKKEIRSSGNLSQEYKEQIERVFSNNTQSDGISQITSRAYDQARIFAESKLLLDTGAMGTQISSLINRRAPEIQNHDKAIKISYSSDENANYYLDAAFSLAYLGEAQFKTGLEIHKELEKRVQICFSFNAIFPEQQ